MVATMPRRSTGQKALTISFPKKERQALAKRKKALAKAKECVLPSSLKKAMPKLKECIMDAEKDKEQPIAKTTICFDKFSNTTKLKFLGKGVSRRVYQFGKDCVVKIAGSVDREVWMRGATGISSNRDEADAYDIIAPAIKKFFIPVTDVADDYFWLVTPKADLRADEDRSNNYRKLKDELLKRGEYCYDVHSDNVAMYNGQWVVIDYGFGCSGDASRHMTRSQREEFGTPSGEIRAREEAERSRQLREDMAQKKKWFERFLRRYPHLKWENVAQISELELVYEEPGHGMQIMNLRPDEIEDIEREQEASKENRIVRENIEQDRIRQQQRQNFIDAFPDLKEKLEENSLNRLNLHMINRREAIYRAAGEAPKVYRLNDIPATELPDDVWESYKARFSALANADRRHVYYVPYENPHELQWDKPGDIPQIFVLHSTESINRVRMDNGLPAL